MALFTKDTIDRVREAVDMESRNVMQRVGRGMLEKLDREERNQKRKAGKDLGKTVSAGPCVDVSLVSPSTNGTTVRAPQGAGGDGKQPRTS